jgi:hypothetical protein
LFNGAAGLERYQATVEGNGFWGVFSVKIAKKVFG